MAATIGVPLYVCGGGTIPLLRDWLSRGMSSGAATSFVITGPATKITNLGALKICLGIKNFIIYILYTIGFSIICGVLTNLVMNWLWARWTRQYDEVRIKEDILWT